jgi:hypothetical protein
MVASGKAREARASQEAAPPEALWSAPIVVGARKRADGTTSATATREPVARRRFVDKVSLRRATVR